MIYIGKLMIIFVISVFIITSMYILYIASVRNKNSYTEGFDKKDRDKKDKDKAISIKSPAPSPLLATPSPAPSPLLATPSPAPSPLLATPSSAPSPLLATPSPAPSPLLATPSPASSSLFATPSPGPSPLFTTPSPSPSPSIIVASPTTAPIFVTSDFGSSATLSVSNQSNYQKVEKQQAMSQKINYEPKNPPYAETKDDQPGLSTSRGGKAGDLQTGFIEKKGEEVQSKLGRDSQKSVPHEGKITSTPASIETEKATNKRTKIKIKKVPAESSSAIVIETLNNEKITFVLPSVFPSIYKTGIDLLNKEFYSSDKNTIVSIPYSISKISVPNGYSVYIQTISLITNKTEIYNNIEEGTKTTFSTPIEINPKKYRYSIMYISPRN